MGDTILPDNPLTEMAEDLIRAYVNWLNSQTPVPPGGSGTPASVGFILSRGVPTDFGPGIAEHAPEGLVYAIGNLSLLGDAALRGPGRFQFSSNNFQTTETLWVQLALPNALSIDASGSSRLRIRGMFGFKNHSTPTPSAPVAAPAPALLNTPHSDDSP